MHLIRVIKRLDAFTLDVDLRLARRVTGVFGPSGSGKSTLLNCIAGLQAPDAGMIRVDEAALFHREPGGRALHSVRVPDRRMGYVFQDPLLFEHMTVEQNLRYARRGGDGPGFSQVVEVLELGALLRRRGHALSGGEKRRVALGRALLSAPRMLLLDEPLTGLERRLAGRTLAYIRAVLDAFALPTLYVSHLVSDILFLCDEVVLLDRGRVAAQGPPRELVEQMDAVDAAHAPGLKNIFAAPVEAINATAVCVRCRVGEQMLIASGRVAEGARTVTVVVPARDIILASSPPRGLSARNVLRGRIQRIASVRSHDIVFIDVGVPWMVEVTSAAVRELGLAAGGEAYAIVKASTARVVDARSDDVGPPDS